MLRGRSMPTTSPARSRKQGLRPRSLCRRALAVAVLVWVGVARPAVAQGDGLYGRFDGDLVVSFGIGASASHQGDAFGVLEARARYLDTAGLVAAWEESPGNQRRLLLALDVRPVFLARFLLDGSSGAGFVDLLIESLSLELGTVFVDQANAEQGIGTVFGAGLSFPLLPRPQAQGLWFRLGFRYVWAGENDLHGPGPLSTTSVAFTLVYRGTVDLGLVRWESRRYELPR